MALSDAQVELLELVSDSVVPKAPWSDGGGSRGGHVSLRRIIRVVDHAATNMWLLMIVTSIIPRRLPCSVLLACAVYGQK